MQSGSDPTPKIFLDLEARFSRKDRVFFRSQRGRAQLKLEAKPAALECDSHRNSLRKRVISFSIMRLILAFAKYTWCMLTRSFCLISLTGQFLKTRQSKS
jgi:hypothetical protein